MNKKRLLIGVLLVFFIHGASAADDVNSGYYSNVAQFLTNSTASFADAWYRDFSQPVTVSLVERSAGVLEVTSNTLASNTSVTLSDPSGINIDGNDCQVAPLCKVFYLSEPHFSSGSVEFSVVIGAQNNPDRYHEVELSFYEDQPSTNPESYLTDARQTVLRRLTETNRLRLKGSINDVGAEVASHMRAIAHFNTIVTVANLKLSGSFQQIGYEAMKATADISLGYQEPAVDIALYTILNDLVSLSRGHPGPAYKTIAISFAQSGVLLSGIWILAGVEDKVTAAYMAEKTIEDFTNDLTLLSIRTDTELKQYAESNILPELVASGDCSFLSDIFAGCGFDNNYDEDEFISTFRSFQTLIENKAISYTNGNFYDDVDGDSYPNLGDPEPNNSAVPAQVNTNRKPTALIGNIVTDFLVGDLVRVDGLASYDIDGDSIAGTHTWTLITPNGSNATLASSIGETSSFTPDIEGSYRVYLNVSDGELTDNENTTVNVTRTYPNLEVVYAGDDVEIYIDNISFNNACELISLPSVTVPTGQKWTRITFWGSQGDVVLLVDDDDKPDLKGIQGCVTGHGQDFDSDEAFDWFNGTASFDWTKDLLPGDVLRFAAFSYEGNESNYNIISEVRVTTDLDGDGVPDEEEDAACLNNSNDSFDSDGDGVCNSTDSFDNDPSAWQDADSDGCPNVINGTSNTGLIVDQFPSIQALCIDADGDKVDDRSDDQFPSNINEWSDADGDGFGDNLDDAFGNDIAASIDSDGDGYPSEWNIGKTASDSTTGLTLDQFPSDPNEWIDSDSDGVGDNSDWAPNDFSEWADSDGDAVGDNADVAPNDPLRSANVAPVIDAVANQQAVIGEVVDVLLTISDDDGDIPVISLVGNPSFVTIFSSTISISPLEGDDGEFTVIVKADDGFGGIASTQFTIAAGDFSPPIVAAPPDFTVGAIDANGTPQSNVDISAFLNAATATDKLDGGLDSTNDAPGLFPIGDTLVTFSATDTAGNTGTASATVTIADLAAPDLSLPTDIEVRLYAGTSLLATDNKIVSFLLEASASDNVDGVTVVTNDAPATLNLGPNIVNFTAVDQAGNSSKGLANVTVSSLDNDSDGIPNDYEIGSGLNPDDGSDASGDLDGDGRSNLDEYLANGNATADDVPPVLTVPSDVHVDSTGPLTPVDLGTGSAIDVKDGQIIPSVDDSGPFEPGRNVITWTAVDQAGNVAIDTQLVDVIPQVSFSVTQIIDEGSSVSVNLTLNGEAVVYPVTVPFTVGGTAQFSDDHNAADSNIVIESGVEGTIEFSTFNDSIWEGDESVEFFMGMPSNAVSGSLTTHTATIREENIAPRINIDITQNGQSATTVYANGGTVQMTALITDPNPGDSHAIDWNEVDNNLIPEEGFLSSNFTFDPSQLADGFYDVTVAAKDDGEGSLRGSATTFILVVAKIPNLLATEDSDGDGVMDVDEGAGDDDMDRIPNYLDAVDEPNLMPATTGSALIQTDPGLRLVLGETAFLSGNYSAEVSIEELQSHGGSGGSVGKNVEDEEYEFPLGIFDFEVFDLEPGDSSRVVIPVTDSIPANAIYRKYYSGVGWVDFVVNSRNSIASAPGELGVCRAPGDPSYSNGLTEGHYCIQLTIADGGDNDSDDKVDGVVKDPGGIAVEKDLSDPNNSSSGGGSSIQFSLILIFLTLGILHTIRARKKALNRQYRRYSRPVGNSWDR